MDIRFKLANPSDEELLFRIQEDPDYDGPPVEFVNPSEGFVRGLDPSEASEVVSWFAGYHGIQFALLEAEGEDLLVKFASDIAAAK